MRTSLALGSPSAQCTVAGVTGSRPSPCSVTCGMGRVMEKRLCNNPAPRQGGNICLGLNTRSHFCNTKIPCPVDGRWSEWGSGPLAPGRVTPGTSPARRSWGSRSGRGSARGAAPMGSAVWGVISISAAATTCIGANWRASGQTGVPGVSASRPAGRIP
ncbi:unnamed protein product [Natator depressus]